MERNENGLYSLFYRDGADTCFNAEGGNVNGNGGGGDGRREGGEMNDMPRTDMGRCQCEGCGNRQLAMVYSPMQCWRRLYTPDDALKNGTLFEELYKPYEEVW